MILDSEISSLTTFNFSNVRLIKSLIIVIEFLLYQPHKILVSLMLKIDVCNVFIVKRIQLGLYLFWIPLFLALFNMLIPMHIYLQMQRNILKQKVYLMKVFMSELLDTQVVNILHQIIQVHCLMKKQINILLLQNLIILPNQITDKLLIFGLLAKQQDLHLIPKAIVLLVILDFMVIYYL